MSGLLGHRGLLLKASSGGGIPPIGNPPDSLPNLTFWLDANDASSLFVASGGAAVSADGDLVGLANSRASIARTFYNAPGLRPAYRTAVANARSVIRYPTPNTGPFSVLHARAGNVLGAELTAAAVVGASAKTIIFAGIVPTARAAQTLVYTNDAVVCDQGAYFGLHVSDPGGGNLVFHAYNYDGNVDACTATGAKNAVVVVTMTHNGTTLRIRVNGGTWATAASGATTNLTRQFNVAKAGSGSALLGMDVGHIVTYNAVPSDADLLPVEQWVGSSLGLIF